MHIQTDRAQLRCHHCGRDYATEYWEGMGYYTWHGLEPCPNPLVCHRCYRDAPAEAMPSQAVMPDTPLPEVRFYPVTKRCYLCEAIWEGKAFTEQPAAAAPLPGVCPVCVAKDEAHMHTLTTVRQPEPVTPAPLARPTRIFGYDD